MPRPNPKLRLLEKIEANGAHVAVVGLGYVGLPLAMAIAKAGHKVRGIDVAQAAVDAVNDARPQITGIDAGELARYVADGTLIATDDFAVVRWADVVVIAVPTPIDEYRVPDLTAVRLAAEAVAANAQPGCLVVLESTTYPGTTEEVVVPAFAQHGLAAGHDVFIAYSPERIDPGNETWDIANTPKVVSGLTEDCLQVAQAFYGTFIERLVSVSSLQTAEITKLFENIFRIVNIALVNEFQQICDAFHVDVWEVIRACSTKPYGFMPFYPGPGLGGHCVPVDPFYLAWKARERRVSTEFIELAGRINASMPQYVVRKVGRLLNGQHKPVNGARVALLGVAYKKNSSDVRESPAIRLVELLLNENANVTYHDPHVARLKVGAGLESQQLTSDYLAAQDCVVIVTDHDTIDWDLVVKWAPLVLDTRNVLTGRGLAATIVSESPLSGLEFVGESL